VFGLSARQHNTEGVIMEIIAKSRMDELTETQVGKVAQTNATFGVFFSKMIDEIVSKIDSMDPVVAARSGSWYFEANAFAAELAAKHNVSIEIAAGVISAVSPRMPWLRNKKVADAILGEFRKYAELSAMDAAKQIGMALSANVSMAVRIARGEEIETTMTGIKRRSFYNNIVNPNGSDSVTVDTWMLMAMVNTTGTDKATALKYITACEKGLDGTGAGYYAISDAVREVAKTMDLKPHQVQALYWVAVSGSFDGARSDIN
jgi:hypothetical protein